MEEKYMQMALREAKKAAKKGEVPVGAVVVDTQTGEILARAHNLCESRNCTRHAEILAIEKACRNRGQPRLWDCDIYVTLEPCTMCAAAVSFARLRRVVFGAPDEKGGGTSFYQQKTCHHKPQVTSGICEQECAEVLKEFFRERR